MKKLKPIQPPDPHLCARLRFRYRNDPTALKVLESAVSGWILDVKVTRLAKMASEMGIDLETRPGPLLLALTLAEKHEPGFQVEGFEKPVGKVGRPSGKRIDDVDLLSDVYETMDTKGLRMASDAIGRMAGRGKWKGYTVPALKTAFSRARQRGNIQAADPFVKFVENRIEEAKLRALREEAVSTRPFDGVPRLGSVAQTMRKR